MLQIEACIHTYLKNHRDYAKSVQKNDQLIKTMVYNVHDLSSWSLSTVERLLQNLTTVSQSTVHISQPHLLRLRGLEQQLQYSVPGTL
jgi:hypothetical protein